MSGLRVNCDEVWTEVSNAEFVNIAPSTEYDSDYVRRLANLIKEALQILQNPVHLSPAQINDLRIKIWKLEAQLAKESALVRRVDPAVPLYSAQ